jgi:SET domain-containing protein
MSKMLNRALFRHPNVVVAPCKFGHGVFATDHIPAETTLEECHHIRIKEEDCSGIIDDYVYGLEAEEPKNDAQETPTYYSLPLGIGSIFNHAREHNTAYWHDTERDLIIFYTIRDISAGEQLFINYGNDWWETREREPDSCK